MKFLVFGVLFLIAAAMVVGLVVGATFKLIGLLFMALIVVAAVSFIMSKVRGSGPTGRVR
ncbi:MAG TPA: hypothetical protein VFV70_15075 [Hyphomonadaceae bacterium]|nr:hypothetical protein [Hyphomonadaceae bacterium]